MGKRGHLPLWKCCKVFITIINYSKTLSRRINYALFSQSASGGHRLQTPTIEELGGARQRRLYAHYKQFYNKTTNKLSPSHF